MNYHELLDNLSLLNEDDQLVEIEKNSDIIFSDEFISLIKGQLQFAAKEMAGAGYFEKIHKDEDAETLRNVQTELREQSKRYSSVWLNMIKINKGFNFRHYVEHASKKKNVYHADEEDLFDYDYCLKCGESGASAVLCGQCTIENARR